MSKNAGSQWRDIGTAPKDQTEIFLRFACGHECAGFYGVDENLQPHDWYEDECDSHSLTELYGQPIAWRPRVDE